MVRDEGQRRLLYDLDCAIRDVRATLSDEFEPAVKLAGVYHNLLRQWADV